MSKHLPNISWHTHLDAKKHGCYGFVRTDSENKLTIGVASDILERSIRGIPRPVASLLAKRIIH